MLPIELLETLKEIEGFDKEAFEKVHTSGYQITSIRINPSKLSEFSKILPFPKGSLRDGGGGGVPWTEYGYYLESRPSFTFDPLFHAGCYYVQEASSMFLEQALKQTVDLSKPLKILDLSAAPGGKSTHIQSLISKESLLVSNEVIKSRSNILKDNIIKWGSENVIVTNNDPRDFQKLDGYFDVIVIDAPCSGSGLFRRDEEAINEWSLNNIQLCSQRQQRIIADVWPALKKNGILIYCTCSYSKEENEDIAQWLDSNFKIENFQLSIGNTWGITASDYGYRFWPDKLRGEGFYIACFRKTDGEENSFQKSKSKPDLLNKREIELLKKWAKTENHHFIRKEKIIHVVPEFMQNDIVNLLAKLRVIYFGTCVGELIREKLIPAHSLALSKIISENVISKELDYDEAINYLKKKDLHIDNIKKGWQIVTFQGCNLGWINVLPNRINNYYPKSLRILKDG